MLWFKNRPWFLLLPLRSFLKLRFSPSAHAAMPHQPDDLAPNRLLHPSASKGSGASVRVWLAGCALAVLSGCTATTAALTGEGATSSANLADLPPDPAAGQPAAVQAELQRLVQTRLELGRLYLQDGRPHVAFGEAERALQLQPRSAPAHNLMGWIYLHLGDFAQADASFGRALRLRPGDADTLYNLGWSQCQQKNYADAHTHFEAAQRSVPRNDEAGGTISTGRILMAQGVCQRDAGLMLPALQTLERALHAEPANAAIAMELAQTYYAQSLWDRAEFYIRRAHSIAQPSAASLWLAIRIARKQHQTQTVLNLARQLQHNFPQSAQWLKYEQGAFDE